MSRRLRLKLPSFALVVDVWLGLTLSLQVVSLISWLEAACLGGRVIGGVSTKWAIKGCELKLGY